MNTGMSMGDNTFLLLSFKKPMQGEFIEFHTFSDEEVAEDFVRDLGQVGIAFKTNIVPAMLDSNFIGASADKVIWMTSWLNRSSSMGVSR